MRDFTQLFVELDEAQEDRARLAALRRYFDRASPGDAAWGLWFLLGRRLKRSVAAEDLRAWAARLSGHPHWLLKECGERVGDPIEAATLLLPTVDAGTDLPLARMITDQIQVLADWDPPMQLENLKRFWPTLDRNQAFIVHKMLSGGFRLDVAKTLVMQALVQSSGVERIHLEHRLARRWQPTARFFEELITSEVETEPLYLPYPLMLSTSQEPAAVVKDGWQAEWWWDGCRAQLIKRGGALFLCSSHGEFLAGCFPEIIDAGAYLKNGTVLDGVVMVWRDGARRPESYSELEDRMRRDKPTTSLLKKAPAVFVAFDLLEGEGADLRALLWCERRVALERVVGRLPDGSAVRVSPLVGQGTIAELRALKESASVSGARGLVLKQRTGAYVEGVTSSDWLRWPIEPLTARLVMVYAQAANAGRSRRFSHYTLAAKMGEAWVTLAKVERVRDRTESAALDRWIAAHSKARRGPVRTVPAEQVFEIAFDGVSRAPRLKSGFRLRNPRVLRWRQEDSSEEVDTLSHFDAIASE